MNVHDELYQHLVKHYLKGKVPAGFDDDFDLIASGVLNSLALVDLLAHVENKYGIEFGVHDIIPEHFKTIDALEQFITQKLIEDPASVV